MTLDLLISKFQTVDKLLRNQIDNGGDLSKIRALDHQINEMLQEIREHRPDSYDGLSSKFRFFLGFLERDRQELGNSFALDMLLEMLNRDLNQTALKNLRNGTQPQTVTGFPPEGYVFQDSVLGRFPDRRSVINPQFRYVNTSQMNGSFYQMEPAEVVGKHVAELIGEKRFNGRARLFLEKAMAGERQQYFHTLPVSQETRVMSCEMIPLYNRENQLCGSMVTMGDVTDHVLSLEALRLEEIREPQDTNIVNNLS